MVLGNSPMRVIQYFRIVQQYDWRSQREHNVSAPETIREPAIRVIVVDDHELVRLGIKRALHRDSHVRVVGEASDVRTALGMIAREKPDVVIVDIRLDLVGGFTIIRTARALAPGVRVLVLSSHDFHNHVTAVFKRGAAGYLVKTASAQELRQAVKDVNEGKVVFAHEVADKVSDFLSQGEKRAPRAVRAVAAIERLTRRENEVLRHLGHGSKNREIAKAMGISLKTVEAHVQSLFLKLKARTRTEAVLKAVRSGRLKVDPPL